MTKPEVIEKTPINLVELREELKAIKKRDGELNFRGGKTEEYLNAVVTLKKKEAVEIAGKLNKLNVPRFKEQYVQKMIDILPRTEAEIKTVLQHYPVTITNANITAILKVLKPYLAKK